MHFRLGLIGALGSGKGSAIEYLRILFPHVYPQSLSDLLREDLRASDIIVTRHTCRDRAHTLRQEHGGDVLMRRALAQFEQIADGVIVIDGIRNMFELQHFKAHHPDAYTIGFPADEEVRFQRAFVKRLRPDEPQNEAELRAVMREEMAPGEAWGFNLGDCLAAADFTVNANLDLEGANRELAAIIKEVLSRCSSAEKG